MWIVCASLSRVDKVCGIFVVDCSAIDMDPEAKGSKENDSPRKCRVF